jgi:recombination protein RecA
VYMGSPETTTGGKALKFYSSMRIEVRKILTLKSGTDIVGGRTRIKVVKNKVSPPFKNTEVDLFFGKGISKEGDIIDLAVQHDIISKTGSWYSYGEEKLGQGKNVVTKLLEDTPSLFKELRSKILEKLGLKSIDEKKPEPAKKAEEKTGNNK